MLSKKEMLDKIEEDCGKANLPLKESATNLVFGKGNPEADIMFIGEAAGRNEDEQGIPFVGAAGKNLDALLDKMGLTLDDVYIANILKYRPPENRDPLPEEIKAHTPWLVEQIKQVRPKVICSLGNYSTKFFLADGDVEKMNSMQGITQFHGKVKMLDFHGLKIKLIPLFHPAAIIYNRSLIEMWEKDMDVVKSEISQKISFKMRYPKEYIRIGNFVFNSGQRATRKYEVEELMTNTFYLQYMLKNIPLSSHYVGIASGGAFMAVAAHVRNPSSKLSIIKKKEGLFGERPIGKWILIDDVITTGGSLRRALKLIGSKPEAIIVAVDRREKNENPKVHSIFEPAF